MSTQSRAEPAGRLPLWLKLAYTAFMAVLLPVYWANYGPTNFLYFCDVALLITLVGIWIESPLLVSMCAVGILASQALWVVVDGLGLDPGVDLLLLHAAAAARSRAHAGQHQLCLGHERYCCADMDAARRLGGRPDRAVAAPALRAGAFSASPLHAEARAVTA